MKKLKLKIFVILVLISFVIFIITTLPYLLQFRESILSNESQDWGSFGSYLSGITSILNLGVFIILTIYVANLSDSSSKMQIRAQKKILISQIRQIEINKLDEMLDKLFSLNGQEKKGELMNIYQSASIFLSNFLNQKQNLFSILKDKKIEQQIKNLIEVYNQLVSIIEEMHGIPEEQIEPWKQQKMENKIQFILSTKNELVTNLQQFLIEDLEN